MAEDRIRVAVLGGGVAALTTAFELTQPSQNDRYEVTIHQLGWRLGGKCASGRARSNHDRVEEHGLHMFMGFYDNLFQVLRSAYEERPNAANAKYKTIYDALIRRNNLSVMEVIDGKPTPWNFEYPPMPGLPGHDDAPPLYESMIGLIEALWRKFRQLVDASDHEPTGFAEAKPPWWDRLFDHVFPDSLDDVLGRFGQLADTALTMLRAVAGAVGGANADHQSAIREVLDRLWKEVEKLWAESGFESWFDGLELEMKRVFIEMDFMRVNMIGAVTSGYLFDEYAAVRKLNEMDYRAWMKSEGAFDVTVNSALVRWFYDLAFAYPEGDANGVADIAAGNAMHELFQFYRYRGSIFWRMRAGTGDIAIAPLYEVLKARGVRFEFFSRVEELDPGFGRDRIETIRISKQATVKDGDYDPLFECDGLMCWPNEPDYDQLVEGEKLKASGENLEDFWTRWKPVGEEELVLGRDYDAIVLGIPIATLPFITPKLTHQNPHWRDMVEKLRTVQTQSAQLWFDPALAEMGWPKDGEIVGAAGGGDMLAWVDATGQLESENWGPDGPKELSYISGVLPGPKTPPPPGADGAAFRTEMQEKTRASTVSFINDEMQPILPETYQDGAFEWLKLNAPGNAFGEARLDEQYLRANIDPDQRYTLGMSGTQRYRLKTDETGYTNLYIAGDWIDNPMNLGSVEAACMTGRLASRALSGSPRRIARVSKHSPYLKMRKPYGEGAAGRLPYYVEYNGVQSFPGPIHFKGVSAWALFLRADYDKLQGLCRNIFELPSDGAVSYAPLSDLMMISVVDVTRAYTAQDVKMGGAADTEMAFWSYLGRRKSPGSNVVESLGVWCPYLFIDNPLACNDGREVYGYMKQMAKIDGPKAPDDDAVFKVQAFGDVPGDMGAPWRYRHLMTVAPKTPGPFGEAEKTWDGIEGAVESMASFIEPGGHMIWPGWDFLKDAFEDMLEGKSRQIFLKQFRDIADNDRACYQAITEAPVHFKNVRGVTFPGKHELTFDPMFNAAIGPTLGLTSGQDILFGMHFTMDFDVGAGAEIWRA